MKSEKAIQDVVLRALKLIRSALDEGENSSEMPKEIYSTVGAEQEMFIVDRSLYLKRPDLVTCGKLHGYSTLTASQVALLWED